MTPLEKEILVGVLNLREEIRGRDWAADGLDRLDRGRWRLEIADARKGLVAVANSSWAAGLDVAGRKAVSRAYSALSAAGLLRQHGDSRTSHLSLTESGERVARDLAAGAEGLP